MPLRRKILLFYALLLLNFLFHAGELYVRLVRYVLDSRSVVFILLVLLHILVYSLLLYIGWLLFTARPAGYRGARIAATVFLTYGLLLAIASVYRNGQVPGNFSGFLYVMICLPLILQLSDYRKQEEHPGVTSGTSLPRSEQGEL
jgi:hypothetical protein